MSTSRKSRLKSLVISLVVSSGLMFPGSRRSHTIPRAFSTMLDSPRMRGRGLKGRLPPSPCNRIHSMSLAFASSHAHRSAKDSGVRRSAGCLGRHVVVRGGWSGGSGAVVGGTSTTEKGS
jgi:hypothetical protein